jgi:hypothetical protein
VCETFPCCLQDKDEKGYSLAWGSTLNCQYIRQVTTEDWWLLRYEAVMLGKWFLMFQRNTVTSLLKAQMSQKNCSPSDTASCLNDWILKNTAVPQIFYCCKFHPVTGHKGLEVEHRYSYTPSLTSLLDRGGISMPCPHHFTPGKENWYLLYRRFNRPQRQSGQVQKISPRSKCMLKWQNNNTGKAQQHSVLKPAMFPVHLLL